MKDERQLVVIKRKPVGGPDYERYEFEKLAWTVHNPNASARQYEEAMQAIAKRCGI